MAFCKKWEPAIAFSRGVLRALARKFSNFASSNANDRIRDMRVAFVHPDLGLGGAERLVVDAAMSLRSLGHTCEIFTPFQNPARTFREVAPPDPIISVTIINTRIPRTFLGRLHAFLAMIRCTIVAVYVCLFRKPHVAIVDLVSAPLFIFWVFSVPTLFYCHFPDKLLAASLNHQQPSLQPSPNGRPRLCDLRLSVMPVLKKIYRRCVDTQEAIVLRLASAVCCNSRFTTAAYKTVFPRLPTPRVIYPCVPPTTPASDASNNAIGTEVSALLSTSYLLSINRYETKKNVVLAVEAFADLLSRATMTSHAQDKSGDSLQMSPQSSLQLIIAGGYDSRLQENVSYYSLLASLIEERGLKDRVHLLQNVTDSERSCLLHHARVLIYTPRDEHFGIVPLEAMSSAVPVVAVNSGGPCESIIHRQTGLLCHDSPREFADAILDLVNDPELATQMGQRGKQHVAKHFSRDSLGLQLQTVLQNIAPNVSTSRTNTPANAVRH